MTEPTATPDTADMAEMLVRLDAKWGQERPRKDRDEQPKPP